MRGLIFAEDKESCGKRAGEWDRYYRLRYYGAEVEVLRGKVLNGVWRLAVFVGIHLFFRKC